MNRDTRQAVRLALSLPVVRSDDQLGDEARIDLLVHHADGALLDEATEQLLLRRANELVTAERAVRARREQEVEALLGGARAIVEEIDAANRQVHPWAALVRLARRILRAPHEACRRRAPDAVWLLRAVWAVTFGAVAIALLAVAVQVHVALGLVGSSAVVGGGLAVTVVVLAGVARDGYRILLAQREAAERVTAYLSGPTAEQEADVDAALAVAPDHVALCDHLAACQQALAAVFTDEVLPVLAAESPAPDDTRRTTDPPRKEVPRTMKQIFVSYARSDMERLKHDMISDMRDAFAVFRHCGRFDLWSDTDIEVGANWHSSIQEALEACDGAILLIGPGFLASDYVLQYELPTLLDNHMANRSRIYPVIVRSCAFARHELSKYQAFNDPKKPVSGMKPRHIDTLLEKLGETIDGTLPP